MTQADEMLTEEQQLAALTPEVIREYATGLITWSQIRERLAVTDFSLILRRLGEEDLRLPRARPDRPSAAKLWLREFLQDRIAAQ